MCLHIWNWACLSRQWFLDRALSIRSSRDSLFVLMTIFLSQSVTTHARSSTSCEKCLLIITVTFRMSSTAKIISGSLRLHSSKWHHMLLPAASLLYPSRPQFSSPASLLTPTWCRLLRLPWLRSVLRSSPSLDEIDVTRSLLEWLIQQYNVQQLWHLAQLILKLPFYLSSLSCDGLSRPRLDSVRRSTMSNTLYLSFSERGMRTLSGISSDELRNWSESTNTVTNWDHRSISSTSLDTRPPQNLFRNEAKLSQRWELIDVLLITRKFLRLFISTTSLVIVSSIVCSRVRDFHLDFCVTLCLSSLSSSLPFCSLCGKIQCLETIFLTSVVLQSLSDDTRTPLKRWPSKNTFITFRVRESLMNRRSRTNLLLLRMRGTHQCANTWSGTSHTDVIHKEATNAVAQRGILPHDTKCHLKAVTHHKEKKKTETTTRRAQTWKLNFHPHL